MDKHNEWLGNDLLERFLRYVEIESTSDRHISTTPSTDCQWDLIRLLVSELKNLGVTDILQDEHGYIIARVPANSAEKKYAPSIGFMAHVDTSEDAPGKNVKPILHENYQGETIRLKEGYSLSPEQNPDLLLYKGDTIITSDGTTLLGADDKAGIAEIMSALAFMQAYPEIQHGPFEIIFTPDEETGRGMDLFPVHSLTSSYCYTVDGGGVGTIEAECFYAYKADVTIRGIAFHLGYARGRLVNAVTMAATFVSLLPQNESPEATDERFGYYCPLEVKSSMEQATVELYLRDFDAKEMERRIQALNTYAAAVEAAFPGGKVDVKVEKQYINMKDILDQYPKVLGLLSDAIRKAGVEPKMHTIRGGTDGARLTEKGVPTPNLFSGAYNFHSRTEWIPVSGMVKASLTILNLIDLWGNER